MDCPHLQTGIRITRKWLRTHLLQMPSSADLQAKKQTTTNTDLLLSTSSSNRSSLVSKKSVASATPSSISSSSAASSDECEQQWRCSGKRILIINQRIIYSPHLVKDQSLWGHVDLHNPARK